MDKNLPEYRTMIQCTPQLEDAMKNDLTKLCGEISAVGLISPDRASALRNPHIDAVERVANLVELVANRVKRNSDDYVLFINKVLMKRWVDNKSILLELEKTYRSLGGKKETDVSNMLSQEAAHPTTIAHTLSEPAMSSALQHSDVPRHRSQSTPGFSVNMTDDEFKRWLCSKGFRKEGDHCVLLDECINAKCLACLKEGDIEAVAARLSIGGRAVFSDICKEAMENKVSANVSANAAAEPCSSNGSSLISENSSTPQQDQLLDMGHHFKVSQCLKDLPNEDLISLGGALGLSFPKLKRMRDFPSEMVAAWLRKEDNVLERGRPTWRILATALKSIGQNGIANSILQNRPT